MSTGRALIPWLLLCLLLGSLLALLLCVASLVAEAAVPVASAEPPGPEALVEEGMRRNADGRYDSALAIWSRLEELAPEDPAAHVYRVETLFWLMLFDDDDERYDARILQECEAAVHEAQARLAVAPDDARSHFLLGQALMHQARLHGIRMRIYRAGQLGERAREELETALTLDPGLVDARFPLGLYYYYASLAPSLAKWLDWLWFVPTGDAETGLRFLEQAAREGHLHRFAAQFFLSEIRAHHDGRLDREYALAVLGELHARHPANSLVHLEWIRVLVMTDRHEEAIRAAVQLEAHPGKAPRERGCARAARIWRARSLLMLGRVDQAWQLLETFGDGGPLEPRWGRPWVQLTRGQLLDVQGQRAAALAAYRAVTAEADGGGRVRELAERGLARPFQLTDVPPPDPPVAGASE